MLEDIKKLSASVGGYMGYSFSVEIDFKKASAKYKFFECMHSLKSTETIFLSESKIENFLKALSKLKITEWKERYTNPGVMDSTRWGVRIDFTSSKKFSSSGDYAYPDRWKAFCNAIKDLVGKDFE